jgi:hypothetical protein
MSELSIENAFRHLQQSLIRDGIERQQTDPENRYYGAVIPPDTGIDNAHATGYFVTRCGTALAGLFLGHKLPDGLSPELLLTRMRIGMDSLGRFQRSSGLIDLRSANYDSAPDTAFVVQALALVVHFANTIEPARHNADEWKSVVDQIRSFVRVAVPGIMGGGFHTPNHRWVISSALSFAAFAIPDLDTPALTKTVESYLAEGFDDDAEGVFIERSAGAYDVINTRSLLILAATWKRDIKKEVYASVRRNLEFNAHLLHEDATIETGLSRRQDYGIRKKPAGLIPSFLEFAAVSGEGLFRTVAEYIWDRCDPGSSFELYYHDMYWLIAVLLRRDIDSVERRPMPKDFSQFYPLNQIWRVRRGQISATVFGEQKHNFLSLVNGKATLFGVSISQTYFGKQTGRFLPGTITFENGTALLTSQGDGGKYRPGYALPLGRRVDRDEWENELENRGVYSLPRAESTVEASELTAPAAGLELRYRSEKGLDDVTTQIFFDFPVGGVWETADTAFYPTGRQICFLRSGYGRMRYGTDCIEIGPGSAEHQIFHLRNSDPVPDGYCRVIISLLTPIDYSFQIRALNQIVA